MQVYLSNMPNSLSVDSMLLVMNVISGINLSRNIKRIEVLRVSAVGLLSPPWIEVKEQICGSRRNDAELCSDGCFKDCCNVTPTRIVSSPHCPRKNQR